MYEGISSFFVSYGGRSVTLEQIITIEAIVGQGSFKAAADFLHKSQPSISMAVKKLEEEYQLTLFSRDEYRPSLTAEGKIFFQKAKALLKEFRELDALGKQMNQGVEVELRISIDAVSPVSLILKFLKNFFAQHPKTKLQLSFEVLHGTVERLIDGEVDLAITPMYEGTTSFKNLKLTKVKLVSVISTQLVKGVKITDDFLRNHNQIILSDSARHLPKMSSGILEGGKSLTISEIHFKKELIMQGLGWGGLPMDLVKSEIAAKKLTVINTPAIKEREMDIFIIRNPQRPMGPVMKELWKRLDEGEF
jgi:DNA-binding transcriptional LysR family regulator